jgi:MFS family permease
MSGSNRWLLPLCLTSFLWAFSFGAGAPLASLWMQHAGFQDTVIGLNTGMYYLGIVLAAGVVSRLLERWGQGCLLLGLAASGLTVVLFPFGGDWPGWFALRLLNGVAGALSLVPLETYVNRQSSTERRAQNFGYYAVCIAVGMALGTLLGMQLYTEFPLTAFVLGGVVPLLGMAVTLGWRPTFPPTQETQRHPSPFSIGRNFLSFGSTWSQGFLEGGMVGLLPLYLLYVGMSHSGASNLMSGLMVGVIVAQVPVAWLADRFGRVAVLVACNVITLIGLAGVLLPGGIAWLALCLLVVGACSGAFYPLGLALLGDRIPSSGLARANAWYLAVNSLGSLVGPALAGAAMDQCGRPALFTTGAATVGLVFALWLVLEIALRIFQPKAVPCADHLSIGVFRLEQHSPLGLDDMPTGCERLGASDFARPVPASTQASNSLPP